MFIKIIVLRINATLKDKAIYHNDFFGDQ